MRMVEVPVKVLIPNGLCPSFDHVTMTRNQSIKIPLAYNSDIPAHDAELS